MAGNVATFGMDMDEVLKLASAWAQLELAITALHNARKALGKFNPADLPAHTIKQSIKDIRRMARDIERLVETQEGNEDDGVDALGEGMRNIVVNLPKSVPKSESNTEMKLKSKSPKAEPTDELPPVPEIPQLPTPNIATKQSGSGPPRTLLPGHKQKFTKYFVNRTKPDFRLSRLTTRPLPRGLSEQNAMGLYNYDCQLHGVQGSYAWFRDNLESWEEVDATVVAVRPTEEGTQPAGADTAVSNYLRD